jgi:hypothetical protein
MQQKSLEALSQVAVSRNGLKPSPPPQIQTHDQQVFGSHVSAPRAMRGQVKDRAAKLEKNRRRTLPSF